MGRKKKTQSTQEAEVETQPEVEETQPVEEVETQATVEEVELTVEETQPKQVVEVETFIVKKLVKNPVRLSFNIVLRDFMPYRLNNLQLANKHFMATIKRSIDQKMIERV